MRKVFKYILTLLIVITFIVRINVSEVNEPRLLMANPGEDSSTEMNINYHINTTANMVVYSTSPSMDEPVFYAAPECVALPFDGLKDEYQCFATLDNLNPNTRYYYGVLGASQNTYKSFITAGAAEFSFAHVTDIHSYKSGVNNTRVAAANKVLNKINEIKDFDFVLASGDVTAYGTVYEQWETLYGMDTLKSKMFTLTPGNHDYYNTSAQVTNDSYFNAVTNNPKNGATGTVNSSYYFRYGNTLFVSLNSEAAANNASLRANQIKWLNEVTANNPADFIVAFTHRPFYTGDGENAGQANDMRSYFQEVFDQTGVDLVLSGHNHVYARTNQVYNNTKVEGESLGTTYITGIQIGDRYKATAGTKPAIVDIHHAGAGQDGGSLITVTHDKILIEFIKMDGTRLYPYEIHSKSAQIDKQGIESSFTVEKNLEENTAVISYDYAVPGHLKNIMVYDQDNQLLDTILNPESGTYEIKNIPNVSRYKLNLKLQLRDNSFIYQQLEVYDERYDYGTIGNFEIIEEELETILTWDGSINLNKVSHLEIYVNDEFLKLINPVNTETVLDKVSPYKENDISVRIVGKDQSIMYTYNFSYGANEPDLTVVFDYTELELVKGKEQQLQYSVYPDQEVKLLFTSSNTDVVTVDEFGFIKAVGAGEATIRLEVNKRWDVNSEVKVIVRVAGEVTEPTPEKKGCFKSGYIFVGLSVFGLTFILRRRKY